MPSMRTSFLAVLALLVLPGAGPRAQEAQVRLLVQASPLAGSQFHDLEALRPRLRVGDPLTLVREPENPHDPRAVRVEWQGHKLGYVPRKENRSVAAALDRLREDPDPWRRLEFEIWMEL